MVKVPELVLHYGYIIIFISLLIGTIGMPDELLLLTVGYFTKKGWLDYSICLIVCFAGTFSGMLLKYYLGKKSGQIFYKGKTRWLRKAEKSIGKAKLFMDKYGSFSILIGCSIPGVRYWLNFLCGLSKMKFHIYSMYAGIWAIIWCFVILTLGRSFGHL